MLWKPIQIADSIRSIKANQKRPDPIYVKQLESIINSTTIIIYSKKCQIT